MPQKQYTIELRVDFSDDEKQLVMREAMRRAAAHIYATAQLISDKAKPQIAVYADDFFDGHQDIDLFNTTISDGVKALDDASDGMSETASEVSAEMLEALK